MTVRELREFLEGCHDDATVDLGVPGRTADTFEWHPKGNRAIIGATPRWARATNCWLCGSTLLPDEKVRCMSQGILCETCLPEVPR